MPWYRHLLWPFAVLYGIGVWIRNRLFDWGIIPSREFDIPIICVGNLEAGGTGKSPVVLYIIKLLSENGFNVAMLSRGYGRSTSGFRLVSDTDSTNEVGDEPLQAKLRFPKVQVAVCESRIEGIERLLSSKNKPDVIVMDDGFQHRYVKAGLNVLVTRSEFPFWKNQLLPVGTLREAKSEQKRAQVLITIGAQKSSPEFGGAEFWAQSNAHELIQLSGVQSEVCKVKSAILFSGIGNADRFERTLSDQIKILDHIKFGDHHNYSVSDIKMLRKKLDSFGAAVDAVITTEKDAARLRNSNLLEQLNDFPVFYLPIELGFNGEDKEAFDKMILDYGKHARKDQRNS